jgi:hypothetical protein
VRAFLDAIEILAYELFGMGLPAVKGIMDFSNRPEAHAEFLTR